MKGNLKTAVVIIVSVIGSASAANYWERLDYRARVTSIKELPPRANEDARRFETKFELLTESKGSGKCAFPKSARMTAEFDSGGNEDVPFLRPGMEIEVECEFQQYEEKGESKKITFWRIWDLSPSIRYKNESGLIARRTLIRGASADYRPPHLCSGRLYENAELEKAGLSAELLEKGVECVAADFDGNGYLDFALFPAKSSESWYSNAQVLFFDGKKIKLVSELKNPPTQLCRAHYGCECFEANERDGLQQNGGGDLDRSAMFLPSTKEWKRFECGGEGDGE